MTQSRYNVPGLERGLRILQLFSHTKRVWTAAEMARALGIPRSTAFRLVQTLEQLGFLERTNDVYHIGPAVLRLGFEYIASLELTDMARPVIERLRDDAGYSAQLVIRDRRDVVVVIKATAQSMFNSNFTVGTRLPAHATVLGRILLSEVEDSELAELYPGSELPKASTRSPKTLPALKKLLQGDRARGYALSESFFEQGISAIAAPIRDESGKVVAALSLTINQSTLDPADKRDRLIKRVLAGAAEISRKLCYRPSEAVA
jgi:DNA-binding IclR family transcriptional regulator